MAKLDIDIKEFSNSYIVKKLNDDNLEEIFNLCKKNTYYYEHCKPFVTRESILADLSALPPKKTMKDKYYVGFYFGEELIAVMDFINAYPSDDICFIGFFMLEKKVQGRGVASLIIKELFDYLYLSGFKGVKLAWCETNDKAFKFWKKQGFIETGAKMKTDEYTAVVAQKLL